MAHGVPMHYGRCQGGPWHAKDMAHATPVYLVAVDPILRKSYPGMQSSPDPNIRFGTYTFDGEAWIWALPDENS